MPGTGLGAGERAKPIIRPTFTLAAGGSPLQTGQGLRVAPAASGDASWTKTGPSVLVGFGAFMMAG